MKSFPFTCTVVILSNLWIHPLRAAADEPTLSSATNAADIAKYLFDGPAHAEANPTQADLEKQVQAEQWTNAAVTVGALLKQNPDDATLKQYQVEIIKHLPAAAPTVTVTPSVAAPVTETEAALKGQDRLDWNTLLLAVNDVANGTDAGARTKAAVEYLDKSQTFVAKHPNFLKAWQYRALAALELDKVTEGSEAGLKLKSFGALDSDDPAMMTLMANLNRKGWLDEAQVEKINAQIKAAETVNLRRSWWQGSWKNTIGGDRILSIDATRVTYTYQSADASTGSNTRFTIPGDAVYTRHYGDGDNDSGSGQVQMLNLKLADDARLLTFESRGSINISGYKSSVQSLDAFFGFYYEPALKDVLLQLSADDLKLPLEELQKKAQAMLVNPTNVPAWLFERQTPPPVAGGQPEMLQMLVAANDVTAIAIVKARQEAAERQAASEKEVRDRLEMQKGKDWKFSWDNGVGIELVWLPAGYWVGKYEVTQQEYKTVMGNNPSKWQQFAAKLVNNVWVDEYTSQRNPVETVSWNDAMRFCQRVTDTGHKYNWFPQNWIVTLPTEKQFEDYDTDRSPEHAVFRNYTYKGKKVTATQKYNKDWEAIGPEKVGTLPPNSLGLYDVEGNVSEWKLDGHGEARETSWQDIEFGKKLINGGVSHDNRSNFYVWLTDRDTTFFSFGFRVVLVPAP